MPATYFTLPTAAGLAAETNSKLTGVPVVFAEMAVGDGGGAPAPPTGTATQLVNERWRGPINAVAVHPDNPAWLKAELVLPTAVGGWTIREFGIFDADGTLLYVGNHPETYKAVAAEGTTFDMMIRGIVSLSAEASVTLKIDPSVVVATHTAVAASVGTHSQSRDHPDASTAAKGFVRLATTAEAAARADGSKAVTPAGIAAALAAAAKTGRARRYFMMGS